MPYEYIFKFSFFTAKTGGVRARWCNVRVPLLYAGRWVQSAPEDPCCTSWTVQRSGHPGRRWAHRKAQENGQETKEAYEEETSRWSPWWACAAQQEKGGEEEGQGQEAETAGQRRKEDEEKEVAQSPETRLPRGYAGGRTVARLWRRRKLIVYWFWQWMFCILSGLEYHQSSDNNQVAK